MRKTVIVLMAVLAATGVQAETAEFPHVEDMVKTVEFGRPEETSREWPQTATPPPIVQQRPAARTTSPVPPRRSTVQVTAPTPPRRPTVVPIRPRTVVAAPPRATASPAPAPQASAPSPASDPAPVASPAPAAKTPELTMSEIASSNPAIPELVLPSAFDDGSLPEQTSENPADAPEVFSSRSESLGKIKNVVPKPEAPESLETVPAQPPGWYKLAAGALFLLSLGYIGYRKKGKSSAHYSDFGGPSDFAGSWLPPRRGLGSEGKFAASYPMENSFLVKKAGGRKTARPLEEAQEPGFHDDVERRVRRLAASQNDQLMDPRSRSRNRDTSAREAEYGLIAEMAAEGISRREIARRLSVPVGEVNAVIGMRNQTPRGSGGIPMEIR